MPSTCLKIKKKRKLIFSLFLWLPHYKGKTQLNSSSKTQQQVTNQMTTITYLEKGEKEDHVTNVLFCLMFLSGSQYSRIVLCFNVKCYNCVSVTKHVFRSFCCVSINYVSGVYTIPISTLQSKKILITS